MRPALSLVFAVTFALAVACGSSPADRAATPTDTPSASERFRSPVSLDSYRWSVEVDATTDLVPIDEAPAGLDLTDARLEIRVEGERQNPDREWTLARGSFGYLSSERETIVIGERLWSKQGNGAWRERAPLSEPEDFIGQDVGLSPAVVLGTDDPDLLQRITDDLMARPFDIETVNGRDARHWVLDSTWLDQAFAPEENPVDALVEPDTVTLHVWTDIETGVATRIVLVAGSTENPQAFRLEMRLFDLNDPEIAIEVPEGAIGR